MNPAVKPSGAKFCYMVLVSGKGVDAWYAVYAPNADRARKLAREFATRIDPKFRNSLRPVCTGISRHAA